MDVALMSLLLTYFTPFWTVAGRVLWIKFCLSVRPSFRQFSWNRHINFSENVHGVREMAMYVTDPDFLGKIPLQQQWPKMVKNGPVGLFKKIYSLVLSEMVWNESTYDPLAKTAYVGQIWFSSYSQKCSRPIRFQYSLIVNISLMDWHLTLIFFM